MRHMECDEALTPQRPVPTPSGRCVPGRRQPVPCWSPSRSSHHVHATRGRDSSGPGHGFPGFGSWLLCSSPDLAMGSEVVSSVRRQLLDGAPVHATCRRREQSLRPPHLSLSWCGNRRLTSRLDVQTNHPVPSTTASKSLSTSRNVFLKRRVFRAYVLTNSHHRLVLLVSRVGLNVLRKTGGESL